MSSEQKRQVVELYRSEKPRGEGITQFRRSNSYFLYLKLHTVLVYNGPWAITV